MSFEFEQLEEIDPVCGQEIDPEQAQDLGLTARRSSPTRSATRDPRSRRSSKPFASVSETSQIELRCAREPWDFRSP